MLSSIKISNNTKKNIFISLKFLNKTFIDNKTDNTVILQETNKF